VASRVSRVFEARHARRMCKVLCGHVLWQFGEEEEEVNSARRSAVDGGCRVWPTPERRGARVVPQKVGVPLGSDFDPSALLLYLVALCPHPLYPPLRTRRHALQGTLSLSTPLIQSSNLTMPLRLSFAAQSLHLLVPRSLRAVSNHNPSNGLRSSTELYLQPWPPPSVRTSSDPPSLAASTPSP